MSKCIKCGRELTSAEIPEFYNGMCDKCYRDYQCGQYPFKKGMYDMQDKIQQLKQQLAEKDKEINSLIVDYEKRISQEQELMSNMEHQLAEKQNTIDEINKEFVQAIHDWKALCAEKDQENERLKQQLEETNAGYDFTYEQSSEAIKELKQNQTQLAIQELEKVSHLLVEKMETPTDKLNCFYYIDQQIKELKGEKDDG